jgi:Lar family restriction alleviation protein
MLRFTPARTGLAPRGKRGFANDMSAYSEGTETMTALLDGLLPCPFCGGIKFHRNSKAKSYFAKKKAKRDQRDTSNYLVRCTKCGAKGPLSHSEGEADVAWNTRISPR